MHVIVHWQDEMREELGSRRVSGFEDLSVLPTLPDEGFGVEPEAAFAFGGGMAVGAATVEDGLNVFAEGVPEDFGDRCIPRIFGRFCSVDI
jgi:hypothetical protein